MTVSPVEYHANVTDVAAIMDKNRYVHSGNGHCGANSAEELYRANPYQPLVT